MTAASGAGPLSDSNTEKDKITNYSEKKKEEKEKEDDDDDDDDDDEDEEKKENEKQTSDIHKQINKNM
jgi:hypothetical protein